MPRPEISEETIQEVEELTEGNFNVAPHKVSFEDRIRILAEEHREALDKLAEGGSATVVSTDDVR